MWIFSIWRTGYSSSFQPDCYFGAACGVCCVFHTEFVSCRFDSFRSFNFFPGCLRVSVRLMESMRALSLLSFHCGCFPRFCFSLCLSCILDPPRLPLTFFLSLTFASCFGGIGAVVCVCVWHPSNYVRKSIPLSGCGHISRCHAGGDHEGVFCLFLEISTFPPAVLTFTFSW